MGNERGRHLPRSQIFPSFAKTTYKEDIVQIKNRIKELRQVKASELLPNPKNWRKHPAGQADALRGALAEIGYADALIAYETDDGLMLIDGHLRAETTPDMEVPVLITDLDEEEANKLLVTLDPLAIMATQDTDKLQALLETVSFENYAVIDMLNALSDNTLDELKAISLALPDTLIPPDNFPSYDNDITTDYKCPSCQYEWSGKPK